MSAKLTNGLRYCSYCDSLRERERCEVCGWRTYSMRTPPPSALIPAWRDLAEAGRAALQDGKPSS